MPTRSRLPRNAPRIFAATLQLLRERGYAGLTIEGVAARSGINKTTLYRWWPSKGALLGAALAGARELDGPPPNTGSLRADLEEILHLVCRVLTGPATGNIAVATLGAVTVSDDVAVFVHDFLRDRARRLQVVFDRAVRRGELDKGIDPAVVLDLLLGAAWMRVAFRAAPVDDAFVQQAVATVLGDLRRPTR